MGLFDESDSDDDVPTTANKGGDSAEDEEEDPLEAYMNSLNDNDNATSSKNNNNCGEGRLDVEAEDEATSHWNIDNPKVNGSGSGGLLCNPLHTLTQPSYTYQSLS